MKTDILIDGERLQSLIAEAALARFKGSLEGYKSPLDSIVEDAFKMNSDTIRSAVYKATSECVSSPDFIAALVSHLNHKLANLIINRCSGLVEKSFHQLMQDPFLRNKLQSAVIAIIENQGEAQ